MEVLQKTKLWAMQEIPIWACWIPCSKNENNRRKGTKSYHESRGSKAYLPKYQGATGQTTTNIYTGWRHEPIQWCELSTYYSDSAITLTQQTDVEREILSRSRCHSLQSYHTPFLSNPLLHGAISPEAGTNKLDRILDGSFFMDEAPSMGLNENQKQWIYEL